MPSQASTADIYVASLYSQGDGLPLWNPSPIRTGAIGYVRDGSFFTLFNIQDGPSMELHPAADTSLFGRRRSTPNAHAIGSPTAPGSTMLSPTTGAERADSVSSGGYVTPPSGVPTTTPHRASDPSTESIPAALRRSGSPSTRALPSSSGPRRASIMGSMRTPPAPPASSLSDPISPTANSTPRSAGSQTPPAAVSFAAYTDQQQQRSPRLRERDLPPEPPLPLQVEYEDLRRFDAGPRSSSTYTCLGFSAGANVPGAPVGGMWSFKSSGGDGALLIPRDPTEREQLRHVGNLKLYVKTHLRWIAYRYAVSEDIEPDDIVLVFSQDRTSDWACAVSRNTSRGAQVDFEVFSTVKASVWGEWRTAMTASQRGPHRGGPPVFNPNFAAGALGGKMQAAAPGPSSGNNGSGSGAGSNGQNAGLSLSVQGLTASFSPSLDASVELEANNVGGNGGEDANASVGLSFTASAAGQNGGGGGGGGGGRGSNGGQPAQQPQGPTGQGWSLANPYPADQAIIIKRITMKHRLPFLPASIRASAGPRPDQSRDRDEGGDRHDSGRAVRLAAGDFRRSGADAERPRTQGRPWNEAFDPLDLLHEYILARAPRARASIASDTECALLLRAAVEHQQQQEPGQAPQPVDVSARGVGRLRTALFRAADAAVGPGGSARLSIDEDGVATMDLAAGRRSRTGPHATATAAAPVLQSGVGKDGLAGEHGQLHHFSDRITA